MCLNKRGAQEGLGWVGYAILILIFILAYYLIFHAGIFGNVKEAFSKTFGTGEEYVELYEEHFVEEEVGSERVIIAKSVKKLIEDTFGQVKRDGCIGYIDLSSVDKDITDYSVYFRKEGEGTKFYVYERKGKRTYAELLKGETLTYGKLNLNLFGQHPLTKKKYNEFWLLSGLRWIVLPEGIDYPLTSPSLNVNNPFFFNYRTEGLRFIFPEEAVELNNPDVDNCF